VAAPTRPQFVACSTRLLPFVQEHFSLPFPDPREQRVSPRLTEGFKADHDYFLPQEISRDPYYQEFLVPRGLGWNAAADLGAGLVLSLKRGTRRGVYGGSELATFNKILPSLRCASRAARLAWQSNFAGQLSAFELVGRGAILLDEHWRVLAFNSCVQFGDGIDVANGRLQASQAVDRPKLTRVISTALAAATKNFVDGPATCVLRRMKGSQPWLLDAMGCSEGLRSLHTQAAVLLLITDLDRPARLTHSRLVATFDLTQTEARLAQHLASGLTVQASADLLGISVGHARQRLKSVFSKVGVARQPELVALIAKMSAG